MVSLLIPSVNCVSRKDVVLARKSHSSNNKTAGMRRYSHPEYHMHLHVEQCLHQSRSFIVIHYL